TSGSLALAEEDSRALADVCLGVHNLESARFLRRHLEQHQESVANVQSQAHYIARYGKEGSGSWVLTWARQKYLQDIGIQGQVLKSVLQATQERGSKMDKAALAMAEDVTVRLLASKQMGLGVELAGLFKLAKTQGALLSIVETPKANKSIRKNAV